MIGSKMDEVFCGDKKEENAVYKITLNQAQEIKEKYLDVIMQMGNFSEEEALEKMGEIKIDPRYIHKIPSLKKEHTEEHTEELTEQIGC